MKKLILTVALFCSTALNAQVKHLEGFEKTKLGYVKTVFTAEEAIKTYSYITDLNGVDTTQTVFTRDDNPIAFSFFKAEPNSKKVNVGAIIHYNGVYDILFMTIKDQDTDLFDVIDKNGDRIGLVYKKP